MVNHVSQQLGPIHQTWPCLIGRKRGEGAGSTPEPFAEDTRRNEGKLAAGEVGEESFVREDGGDKLDLEERNESEEEGESSEEDQESDEEYFYPDVK